MLYVFESDEPIPRGQQMAVAAGVQEQLEGIHWLVLADLREYSSTRGLNVPENAPGNTSILLCCTRLKEEP